MKNFHLPLPDATYDQLRDQARRSRRPATALARQAIEEWLAQCRRAARHEAIAKFAAEHAGTPMDLDPALEEASIQSLAGSEHA